MSSNTDDPDSGKAALTKRKRRAEPITKRISKNGSVTYEFRADVGGKPDGTRDRRRFTYRTLAEAKREYRASQRKSWRANSRRSRP